MAGALPSARLPSLRRAAPLVAGVLALAACGTSSPPEGHPLPKPARLATVLPVGAGLPATVVTKRGEVVLRDLEGRRQRLPLDSAEMRAALGLATTSADRGLVDRGSAGKGPADKGIGSGERDRLSAQARIEADFAAQRRPILPPETADSAAAGDSVLIASKVVEITPEGGVQAAGAARKDDIRLVEATVNLRRGVDADTAFAYATCALAGWAKEHGVPYARHIRTLRQRKIGRLLVASAFAVSRQPPMGLSVMEAGPTLAECRARGIPAT